MSAWARPGLYHTRYRVRQSLLSTPGPVVIVCRHSLPTDPPLYSMIGSGRHGQESRDAWGCWIERAALAQESEKARETPVLCHLSYPPSPLKRTTCPIIAFHPAECDSSHSPIFSERCARAGRYGPERWSRERLLRQNAAGPRQGHSIDPPVFWKEGPKAP